MMSGDQNYFKPWRLVEYVYNTTLDSASYTGTTSFTVLPSQIGLTAFANDDYYFEIRFIGHRSIYPICQTLVVSSIMPPTPTPSLTPMTPTPTPTPSPTPSVIDYTSGATLNVTETGWIKYNMSSGSTYQFIASTGTVTLTNCLDCDTIMVGIPFADLANFTVTNCGSSCSAPAPTPPPSATVAIGVYYRMISCQNYQSYYTRQVTLGVYQYGERVQGNDGFFVIQEYQTNQPDTQTIVMKTGQFGCP